MTVLQHYYYRRGKLIAKAVGLVCLATLFLAIGLYAELAWDLSFLFTDWKGYVILIVYGLVTLGTVLACVETFAKLRKAGNGVPALTVADDRFVTYDTHALPQTFLFDDCERINVKRSYHRTGTDYTLVVTYEDPADRALTQHLEIDLNELDRPVAEIEKTVRKAFNTHKQARGGY